MREPLFVSKGERCHCESMSACQEGSIKTMLQCSLRGCEKSKGGNTWNNCGQNIIITSFDAFLIKMLSNLKDQVDNRIKCTG